jgi:hypothetical protein
MFRPSGVTLSHRVLQETLARTVANLMRYAPDADGYHFRLLDQRRRENTAAPTPRGEELSRRLIDHPIRSGASIDDPSQLLASLSTWRHGAISIERLLG